ncbi:MAG: DegT/DnrJ/EryC1/StrS family aminotransferase [Spirochaetaceae bacterium]|jgi:dTDP-4-amino-4,6-dideoxygalactose transaminase|nr:DegT/DnrJ/EryC1/StrS family aminotransferase [Spirochaetaceae bacterium]
MKIEVYSPTIRRKEMDAVLTALVEDKIGPGEHARSLIQLAKEYLGFDYCLGFRSPAAALFAALKALRLEPGQSALVSALSPGYYAQVLADAGLRPIFADAASGSPCPEPEHLSAAIAANRENPPKCIIAHHTLGYTPDMEGIARLGVPVIEDISQSYGTVFSAGKKAGSFGTFTLLGLEERDVLTAGGGALLYATNRRDAGVLRNSGTLPPEYGLPDMNAAMAIVQFRESAKHLEKRREIAQVYTQAALRTRHKRFIQRDDAEYNCYAFPLILETGAKDVKAYAKHKEIDIESAFDHSIIGNAGADPAVCPESYSLSLRTVLFPLYPRLRGAEIEQVAKLIGTLP